MERVAVLFSLSLERDEVTYIGRYFQAILAENKRTYWSFANYCVAI